MIKDPVAARYASAFFELAKREGRLDEASRQLEELAELIQRYEELRQLLLNPNVEAADKLHVLGRLLDDAWSADVRAFVQMVLAMGRAEQLVEVVEAFGELVDDERRLARVTVRAAHPLPESLKTALRHRLEQLERRHVELIEEAAPELIGGIQVLVGHRMLDGSLRAKLTELRQRLKTVRVH